MTSKSLLRHPLCKSSIEDMQDVSFFQRLIPETNSDALKPDAEIKRVIFCSGQVYYALLRAREANNLTDIAIARVEQLSPFPYDLVQQQADRYPKSEIIWVQEEPLNMGGWTFAEPRIVTALDHSTHHKGQRPSVISRESCGYVATGIKKMHEQEENMILSTALMGQVMTAVKVFQLF